MSARPQTASVCMCVCMCGGMCIWDTANAELGMEISNIDSGFMAIKSKKIWATFCIT